MIWTTELNAYPSIVNDSFWGTSGGWRRRLGWIRGRKMGAPWEPLRNPLERIILDGGFSSCMSSHGFFHLVLWIYCGVSPLPLRCLEIQQFIQGATPIISKTYQQKASDHRSSAQWHAVAWWFFDVGRRFFSKTSLRCSGCLQFFLIFLPPEAPKVCVFQALALDGWNFAKMGSWWISSWCGVPKKIDSVLGPFSQASKLRKPWRMRLVKPVKPVKQGVASRLLRPASWTRWGHDEAGSTMGSTMGATVEDFCWDFWVMTQWPSNSGSKVY